jgi:hypothetical protein
MNFKQSNWWKRAAAMFVLATASLLLLTATSFAQGHDQGHERRDLKDHQRQERYYGGNGYATRDHQSAERDQLKHEQRAERNGGYYNNGGYNNGSYNNGGYGHANNGNYNNGGYYNGNGHANNGYYNNGGYYNGRRPHYDSGSFGNRLHHAFGGH